MGGGEYSRSGHHYFIAVFCLARLKNRVRKSQNTLKSAIDAANIIIIILDQDGTVLDFNKHAKELFDDIRYKERQFSGAVIPQRREKLKRRMDKRNAPIQQTRTLN